MVTVRPSRTAQPMWRGRTMAFHRLTSQALASGHIARGPCRGVAHCVNRLDRQQGAPPSALPAPPKPAFVPLGRTYPLNYPRPPGRFNPPVSEQEAKDLALR